MSQLQHGLTLEFEHSDPLRRLRLTLSELLAIMNKVDFYYAKLELIHNINRARLMILSIGFYKANSNVLYNILKYIFNIFC